MAVPQEPICVQLQCEPLWIFWCRWKWLYFVRSVLNCKSTAELLRQMQLRKCSKTGGIRNVRAMRESSRNNRGLAHTVKQSNAVACVHLTRSPTIWLVGRQNASIDDEIRRASHVTVSHQVYRSVQQCYTFYLQQSGCHLPFHIK